MIDMRDDGDVAECRGHGGLPEFGLFMEKARTFSLI